MVFFWEIFIERAIVFLISSKEPFEKSLGKPALNFCLPILTNN